MVLTSDGYVTDCGSDRKSLDLGRQSLSFYLMEEFLSAEHCLHHFHFISLIFALSNITSYHLYGFNLFPPSVHFRFEISQLALALAQHVPQVYLSCFVDSHGVVV